MNKSANQQLRLLLAVGFFFAAAATARPLAQGPTGAALFQKAQQQEAAGNKAAAATTYQQAYEAFMSVDDSDGMTKALARKQALAGAAPVTITSVAASRPAATRPMAPPVAKAAPRVAGPAPQAGRMVGGRPVGLFFVTKSVLGRFMTMSYYFSPDGVAYENPVGLSAAELAATPAKSKGRYSVTGKTLTIAWNGYPKPEAAEMNMLGGGFSWSGGSIFSAVGPFTSAAQLVGKFEGGSSTYSPMGGVLSSRTLTFRPDGTFTGGGVVTVTSVTERSVAETGGSSNQTGRWSLSGWYLTLTDAQGHTIRDVAYPIGTGKVSLFNFNGTAYSRQ